MQKGQALIVILLVLAIALTVGLAVVSRSVTDIGTSTTQEESSRALSAAEASIEEALAAPMNEVINTVSIQALPYSGNLVSIAEPLAAGESATIFLTGHDNQDNLQESGSEYADDEFYLCWGTPVSGSPPPISIEASLFYKDNGEYKVQRYFYNSTQAEGPTNCPGFIYQKAITSLPDYKLFLKVKLLYNGDTGHYVALSGSFEFPIQGKNIIAEATEGSTTRKIEVWQRYPDLFPVLDSAVYSNGGIAK